MTDKNDQPSLSDATPEALTNFDRLAAALPEESLAAKLLDAWRSGDASSKIERMLAVAQPVQSRPADDTDASVD